MRWLDGSRPEQKLAPPELCADVRRVLFSPDDRYLAVRCQMDEGLWLHAVYELAGGKVVFAAPASDSATQVSLNLDFDATSQSVVATHRDGSVRWHELPSGVERRKWDRDDPPNGISLSPDGRSVALWRGPQVEVLDVETKKSRVSFKTNSADIHQLTWGPDGRRLACGAADHCAYLWDIPNREHRLLEGHQSQVVQVVFHPSGHLLATTSIDGTTRLWDVWTGEERVAVLGSGVQFSRDGKRLAHGMLSNVAGWWDVAAGAELRRFPRPYAIRSVSDRRAPEPADRGVAWVRRACGCGTSAAAGNSPSCPATGRTSASSRARAI